MILSPSSSHSRMDPGPTPSLRRTSAGTEIWPWEVSLEWASGMFTHYHGNADRYSTSRGGARRANSSGEDHFEPRE
jgi:hypothetical protein